MRAPPLPAAAAAAANATLANATGAAVALRTSLNAQDYTDPIDYFAYVPPSLSSLTVVSGPADGGTVVTVRGAGLGVPTDPKCRFGAAVHTVAATVVAVEGANYTTEAALVCTSPPRARSWALPSRSP